MDYDCIYEISNKIINKTQPILPISQNCEVIHDGTFPINEDIISILGNLQKIDDEKNGGVIPDADTKYQPRPVPNYITFYDSSHININQETQRNHIQKCESDIQHHNPYGYFIYPYNSYIDHYSSIIQYDKLHLFLKK